MKEMLEQLVGAVLQRQEVGAFTRSDNLQILAYPWGRGVIIGMGLPPDRAHHSQIRAVLRKRAENLQRFGSWLPTLLSDGRWGVLAKVPEISEGAAIIPDDLLMAAEELLS
ncbi:MAG: hypothetical protein V7642_275 [Burkholderiales bacterium]|jgi:hypothetical protein